MRKIWILLMTAVLILAYLVYRNTIGTPIVYVPQKDKDARSYLMETYDLTKEELEGYDLDRLMADYDFDEEYTGDEIREILRDQGKYYLIKPYTEAFALLDAPEGGEPAEGPVTRIGLVYNEGTQNIRAVYDLTEQRCYYNENNYRGLTGTKCKELRDVMKKTGAWDSRYEGPEEDTTGSLYWKLVLETDAGQTWTYSGYTGDGSHLPNDFGDVVEPLLAVIDIEE